MNRKIIEVSSKVFFAHYHNWPIILNNGMWHVSCRDIYIFLIVCNLNILFILSMEDRNNQQHLSILILTNECMHRDRKSKSKYQNKFIFSINGNNIIYLFRWYQSSNYNAIDGMSFIPSNITTNFYSMFQDMVYGSNQKYWDILSFTSFAYTPSPLLSISSRV